MGRCPASVAIWDVRMRGYTANEKLKITAGAISAVVIVGWLAVFAFALLASP